MNDTTPEPTAGFFERTEMSLYGDKGTGRLSATVVPWWSMLHPLVALTWIRHFGHLWITTRPWVLLITGAPALIVAIVCVGLAGSHHINRHDLQAVYQRELARAIDEQDWEKGAVLVDRLLSIRPQDPEFLFRRALVHHNQGNVGLANVMLAELAPEDRPGLPDAHFEMARRAKAIGDNDRALKHLQHAVVRAPNNPHLHGELGQMMLANEQREEALYHFERARQIDPTLGMTIGDLYARAGLLLVAKRVWRDTADYYETQFAELGEKQHLLDQVQALLLADQFQEAERALINAIAKLGHDEVSEPLAALYTAQAKMDGAAAEYTEQWDMLTRAIAVRPQHEPALIEIAKFAYAETPEAAIARERIRELLGRGEAPAAVHLVIGSIDAQDGKWEAARLHLEQAQQRDPRMPIVLNNLAWVIFHQDPSEAQKALIMVNEAARLAPNVAAILDTRAAILLELDEPHGAIRDLEDAVRLRPNHATYLQRLAEAYQEAGDEQSAESIRKRIERLPSAAEEQLPLEDATG